ncbi:MAG: hypothetical protein EA402_06915 [Planctomycetota bacterium]|nr:MAG: hypothetical protein EA402_06915 [Planctomycetota bacterium]
MPAIIASSIIYLINLLIRRWHQGRPFSRGHSLLVAALTLLVNLGGLWAALAFGLPSQGDLSILVIIILAFSVAIGVATTGLYIVAACVVEQVIGRRVRIPWLIPVFGLSGEVS